ncbi:uncharacterized protein LOC110847619 [Folsomia candida]|uniref:uncharacterized protein LOC110847619 n=1 Tax=Folsomia candida TaxID=158441 RepID=UPI000B909D3D|nr:uncharacterized protein LOC110847619 [Folsomia candida]
METSGDLVAMEIIKPPEGFGDEKELLYKKKKKKSIRAKSEERYGYKMDASTQSSISLHASLHDLSGYEDDDTGIYLEGYNQGVWVYISQEEEVNCWNRHEPLGRMDSGDSTEGEREFAKKFIALTHRMVHRRASGECYRRLGGCQLEINKRISLHRTPTTEYGFRIHGSRPVVVSAVELASPAELAGLEVGDVIMSINGLQVLDSSHSDVVRIASGAESLELELARTKNVVMETEDLEEQHQDDELNQQIVLRGELGKFNGMDLNSDEGRGARGVWVERHFTLTRTTLSYSKTPTSPPLKIISLWKPSPLSLTLNANSILTLSRGHTPLLLLTASSPVTLETWMETMATLISNCEDKWVENSGRLVSLVGAEKIGNPDCSGWVWKLGRRVKSWGRRFCVLKDAVVYFFNSQQGEAAFGASHLHGYRVQTVSILGGKRHAFELLPPEMTMRHYYLAVDTENERKRWLAALEYSIDRWINLASNNIQKF